MNWNAISAASLFLLVAALGVHGNEYRFDEVSPLAPFCVSPSVMAMSMSVVVFASTRFPNIHWVNAALTVHLFSMH
jgi:hypothetical protein